MKAAVMEDIRKPLVVREMPDPKIFPGGAVVRVEANGICRSDWHAWVGDWSWFDAMLQMVQSGKLAPGKLVSRTVPLEEAGSVLAAMDSFATVGVTVIDRY